MEEALKTLVPNSKEQVYLRFCEEFKKFYKEKKISKELDSIIEAAKSNDLSEKLIKILETRKELLEYDLPSTSQERKDKIIDDLFNNYCGENLEYEPPFFARGKKSKNEDEKEKLNNTPKILTEQMIADAVKQNIEGNKYSELYEIQNTPINKRHKLFLEYLDKKKDLCIDIITKSVDIPFYLMSSDEFTKVIDFLKNSEISLSEFNYLDLTVGQIMRILAEINISIFFCQKTIMEILIIKKYEKPIKKAKKRNDLNEVKKHLWEFYEISKKYCYEYVSGILLYILKLNKMENIFEIKTLEEYLKFPIDDIGLDKIYSTKKFNENVEYICVPDIDFDQIRRHKFIENLLIEFLVLNKAKKDDFSPFFKKDYLEKINLIADLYKGKEISSEKYKDYLKDSEYDELVKKTEMTICEHNPKEFKINEDIKIDIDFKNIKSINISIYEINTENYYLETKAPLNSLFNIEGIIASNSIDIKIEGGENPSKRIRKTIELNQIEKGKRGIFLVEILGKGISSRIIIKRGRLNLITRNTSKGLLCQIINENNEIMKEDKTYLWYNNIKFTCEPKEGIFVLPYKVLVDPSNMYISP